MKHIKTIGLAVVASLAMTMLASATSASASVFEPELYPSSITSKATSETTFTFNDGTKIACEAFPEEFFAGALGRPPLEAPVGTLSPMGESVACSSGTWGSSKLEIIGSAENSACAPILHAGGEFATGKFKAAFDIGPAGCTPIKINGALCDVWIGPQSSRLGGELANQANGGGSTDDTVDIHASPHLTVSSEGCGNGLYEAQYGGSWSAHAEDANGNWIGLHVGSVGVYTGPSGFEAESYPAQLAGEQAAGGKHVLMFGGRSLECERADLSGEMASASSELAASAGYSGCRETILGTPVLAAVVNNSCHFVFQSNGTLGVTCSKAGDAIEVRSYENAKRAAEGKTLCVHKIGAQSGRGGVTYSTVGEGAGRGIGISLAVKSLTYSNAGNSFICGGSGTFEASYSGASTLY